MIIPLYHKFKFCVTEIDDELFHNRRLYYYTLTSFWDDVYCARCLRKKERNKRYLIDDIFVWKGYKVIDQVGIPLFVEDYNQFKNNKIEYSVPDFIKARLKIKDGKYIFNKHDQQNMVIRFTEQGCDSIEWVEDLVKHVNYVEERIVEELSNQNDLKWSRIRSQMLTDGYIKEKLKRDGLPDRDITWELIEIERLIIKTKRKLKNYKLC